MGDGGLRVLVTAGNTQTPIDRVRCITNIFTGRTGAGIAVEGENRGHTVTVLTSHPELLAAAPRLTVKPYRTFDDLAELMEAEVTSETFDVLIHAAAVSDYSFAGIFAPDGTGEMRDIHAGKVKSHHPEVWLKLTRTPKLADRVRDPWGFRGVFVKFKLEVGVTDTALQRTAKRSRKQSDADLMVANTLDEMTNTAFIGGRDGLFERVARSQLPMMLWDRISALQNVKS